MVIGLEKPYTLRRGWRLEQQFSSSRPWRPSSCKPSLCHGDALPGHVGPFCLATPGYHQANAQWRAALLQAGARGGTVGGAQVVGGPEDADHHDAECIERIG